MGMTRQGLTSEEKEKVKLLQPSFGEIRGGIFFSVKIPYALVLK